MKSISVWPVGSILRVGGDIDVRVLHVRISEGFAVDYFVSWWHEGQRHTEWVPACELSEIPAPQAVEKVRVDL